MAVYNSYMGKSYTLAAKLGSGGEGVVYEIQGDLSKVAKIYKKTKFKSDNERSTMDRKLKAMINMNIAVYVDGMLRLAWPLDILYENGCMVGFVMPKINSKCKIFDIQREGVIKRVYPNYTWKYAVQFAYNLSWVVKYLHDKNIVIGDLNQNNICIDTSTGAVILIDCDSFDIRDSKTGEHFPCVVGLPEMLAPELQTVGHLSKGTFTEETDNFSLAIHIFRLLMKNADPFGGITQNRSVSNIPANAPIINGECAYVRNVPGKTIAGWSPTLDMLPVDIQQLFKRTFDYDANTAIKRINNRATAMEWCTALAFLGAPEPNPNLKTCSVNKKHVYPKHSSYCPWCRCEGYRPPTSSSQTKSQLTTNSPSNISAVYVPSKPAAYTYTSPKTVQANIVAGNNQRVPVSGGNPKPRRTSYLFYCVLIVFGLASGFAFGQLTSVEIYSLFDLFIDPIICTVSLSTVGVIGGAAIAHHFENRYIYADNAIPWLFLAILALFLPVLVAIILGIIVGIVIFIFSMIVAFLIIIILFGLAVSYFVGS